MTTQSSPTTNVFDAAKAIVEAVSKLDNDQQEQAIRFAAESLGLRAPSAKTPPQPAAPTSLNSPHAVSQTHSTDIKQFTAAKAPKSDQQFAAVAAYFYRFEAPEDQRKEAIDLDDLKNAARLASRRVPGRFALNNARNAGYLDTAGRGKFKINTVGENLVAITLPGDGSDGSSVSRGRSARNTKKRASKKRSKKKARGK